VWKRIIFSNGCGAYLFSRASVMIVVAVASVVFSACDSAGSDFGGRSGEVTHCRLTMDTISVTTVITATVLSGHCGTCGRLLFGNLFF
jgi:hypothetical protein